jgi:hypothetical protein
MTMLFDLQVICSTLLAKGGIDASIHSLTPCNPGGNNRTYHLQTSKGSFAVKQYFRHQGDTRDRLAAEFSFLSYASKVAPRSTPAPISMDNLNGFALFEFIEGCPYKLGEISWTQVEWAIKFFKALNNSNAYRFAEALPAASEACFSINEHINLITNRVNRLRTIEVLCDEDRLAKALMEQIHNRWLGLKDKVLATSRSNLGHSVLLLAQDQRCVSPSDFGFHNAFSQPDGTPRFFDFEYAGWDDPAKMICDFFAQIAVPVPSDLFDHFVQEITEIFPRPEVLAERARLLRPLYQIKWCCIALNVFLPVDLVRRKFANSFLDENTIKQAQLFKAESLFKFNLAIDHGLY